MEQSKDYTPITNINKEKLDIPALIKFRRWVHQNAELSLKEFKTQKKIKDYLIKIGVPNENIISCAGTGLKVDIWGKALPKGNPKDKKIIAYRSDHDALPMKELTGLSYSSKTNAAHMCGHDGHTACNLGGASLYMSNLDKIPSNRAIRLIFQLGEEGHRGARLMIKEGVLDNVNEIYGMHNAPINDIKCKIKIASGTVMAQIILVEIKLIGKGGHGSIPELCNNPLICASKLYIELYNYLNEYQKNHKIRFSFTSIQGGNNFNIIPDNCIIQGSIRIINNEDQEIIENEIRRIITEISKKEKIESKIYIKKGADGPVINDPKCAEFVKKMAIEQYGEDRVDDELLPFYSSEDFADYLFKVPGAFYFVIIKDIEGGNGVHSSIYDFDDTIIEQASELWYRIIVGRLNDI